MRSLMRFIFITALIASATQARADTLQIFWNGPTSFTFDTPSQFIVSLAVPGNYFGGATPCLFSGLATSCDVMFATGGVFPFAGIVVRAHSLGTGAADNVIGPSLINITSTSDSLAGFLNIPTGNYSVQMNQIITGLNNTAPGILYVTDLSIPPAVPEPSTFALLGTGILCLAGAARRQRGTHHVQPVL